MPAYNEEKRIGPTLKSYSRYFESIRKLKHIDYEIIVVINNTNDNTIGVVKTYQNNNQRIWYLNLLNGGKGYAIIEGFREALKGKSQMIGFVDADGSTSPKAFYKLIESINGVDGVIASRYLKGAIVEPAPKFRRIFFSRVYNFIIKLLFFINYQDTQCGAKLFRKKALQKAIPNIRTFQWAFDIDLIYQFKKNNFKITEIPTVWKDKNYSKLNLFSAGPSMMFELIKLRLLNLPFSLSKYKN
ncbi:MAG: glycosyltransferase [Nanoarchaeota archaeon]